MQILESSNVLTRWSVGLWDWLTPFVKRCFFAFTQALYEGTQLINDR